MIKAHISVFDDVKKKIDTASTPRSFTEAKIEVKTEKVLEFTVNAIDAERLCEIVNAMMISGLDIEQDGE